MLRLSASAFRSRFKRLGDIKKRYAEKTSTAVSIRSLLAFLERLFKIGSPFGCYILNIITPYTWAIKLIRFATHAARPPGGRNRRVPLILTDYMPDCMVELPVFAGIPGGLRGPIPGPVCSLLRRRSLPGHSRAAFGPSPGFRGRDECVLIA